MNIADIWKYELRAGDSKHPAEGACLFDAGMWLVYGKIGDNPPCSCPVIRVYGIGLNDGMNDKERQLLKPFILRIVGNKDPDSEPARLRYIILETARKIVPLAFDKKFPKYAEQMRNLSDNAEYKEIENLMRNAANAAANAAYAAAYAAANAAANAAYAAANAAANAAYAAAYAAANAANAAAANAAYDATRQKVWREAIKILDSALRIGKQSPEFDEAAVRESVRAFELARAQ
jgi:hypothetical protein